MPEAQFAAAVDQGTTGTRCMIFTHDGRIHAAAYEEHPQIYPQPGWVEHDPLKIWETTQAVIRSALERGRVAADQLTGIGVTNQRETTLLWDRGTGRPVYNAIVWQDTRTREICQRIIDEGFEPYIRKSTGLLSATYFSGPKLKWIFDQVAGVRAGAARGEVLFGTIDTWLIW